VSPYRHDHHHQAGKEILHSRDPKVHYRVHKNWILDPVPNVSIPVAYSHCSSELNFNTYYVHIPRLDLMSWYLPEIS
jgi:hypothetical protein